jgi:hypothetical protein
MSRRPSKREQYERLANPDQQTLEAFAELDREEQLGILAAIRGPAKNPKVAKAERELAKRRAAVFRKHLKPNKED